MCGTPMAVCHDRSLMTTPAPTGVLPEAVVFSGKNLSSDQTKSRRDHRH